MRFMDGTARIGKGSCPTCGSEPYRLLQERYGLALGLNPAATPTNDAGGWPFAWRTVPTVPQAASLRFHTLGAFRVWRGQQELDKRAWGREKARQLLHLFLVFRGRMLPKARIIDLLWPDADPRGVDGNFRVALNALHKTLEPGRPPGRPGRFIVRQGTTYGLAADPAIWIDTVEFERLLDEARELEIAAEDATDLYRRALELYEGLFLGEFPDYEAWCERERERLDARFTSSALRLAGLLARQGAHDASARWAQRLLHHDPCLEEAYRLLMLAQYRLGNGSLALRTYERCRAALAEELDVEPGPEINKLCEQIRKREPAATMHYRAS